MALCNETNQNKKVGTNRLFLQQGQRHRSDMHAHFIQLASQNKFISKTQRTACKKKEWAHFSKLV